MGRPCLVVRSGRLDTYTLVPEPGLCCMYDPAGTFDTEAAEMAGEKVIG